MECLFETSVKICKPQEVLQVLNVVVNGPFSHCFNFDFIHIYALLVDEVPYPSTIETWNSHFSSFTYSWFLKKGDKTCLM